MPEGISLIEQHLGGEQDLVTIPYSKYQLANGLTVVLHQDKSDPLVHVDVTYHVGSAREQVGKSGFAHFFEHMMFQGSKNVADDEHFKIITEVGGDMNGTTNSDRTNYYQTVPANQLEKVLWLEADRMGFLLDAVTQEKFEIQRETVKNERGQSYDNQPYGLRTERNSEALYPIGHPYSWSTIGYVEDLDRVNVNDLKAFFQRWYGPNNAVLTIGGDIDQIKTLQWINKYFSTIPSGPEVKDALKQPVILNQDRYLTLEDEVYLPLLQLTFPTVYVRHQDEAPLDVLADILGGGKTSLFYKNLVKDNIAVQAVVSHPCRELACEFQLIALPNPGKTTQLADIQRRIEDTLIEFEQRGVNTDDLARTKASIQSSTIFGLQSVSGKVSILASNQTFDDQPDMVQYDLNRYNNVSAADVMRVYRTYIKDKSKVVLSIVPKGSVGLAAKPQNFELPERTLTSESDNSSVSVVAKTIQDSFDRSIQPSAGPNPSVTVPQYSQKTFDNGIRMLTHHTSETPTVSLLLSLEGGPLLDPIEKAGLASFTASMMNETTSAMSNEVMANQLALLGSRISFSANGRFTQIQVNSLTQNLTKTLALLKVKLFSPAFKLEDFQRIKQNLAQQLQQQLKNPSISAAKATDLLMYGAENRISLPDSGTLTTLQNIQLDDVKEFYRRYYSPAKANLVVVGDIDEQKIAKRIPFLTEWQNGDYDIPQYSAFPEYEHSSIYLIDKPDAAQTVVQILKRGLPYDATGTHFKSKLMNFPLGGMFNSRINLNLREDKGYTYGASSRFVGGKTLGRFQAGADLKKENSADGIREILQEIATFKQQGMTIDELQLMKSAYTQAEALSYETPFNKATFLNHLLTYDLAKEYRDVQYDIIDKISLEELNDLANELLDINELQIVVVGDAAAIRAQLATLGLPIVDMQTPQ
ncbi:pitrilysin family protein [Aliiglaciecola sp. LCG003]|uniref:M16 family metallopeptidase n=1 Tax=Aliiglaciecola sp. LCG003 TaxID=3053655 RepID=UPI002572A649|nr:pitrilysin family protein [Aliiglaciecola sp. LCG003]WJG11315.1 pitrilysin family protein [Aliiglaciecola sp. LCG003]